MRELNPDTQIVGVTAGRIDPTLLYDVSARSEEPGQLSFRELLLDGSADAQVPPHADDHDHAHADSVTVTSDGCVDPDALFDLLENPPSGVYRLKGVVAVRYRATVRHYVVNLVGTSIHVAGAPPTATTVGPIIWSRSAMHLDTTMCAPASAPHYKAMSDAASAARDSPAAAVPPAQHLTNRHLPSTFSTRPAISSIASGPRTRSTGRPDSTEICSTDRSPRAGSASYTVRSLSESPSSLRHRMLRLLGQFSTAPDDFHDLIGPCHQYTVAPQQLVTPRRGRRGDRPGTAHTTRPIASAQDAVLAAPLRKARFHDHGGATQHRHQPVAGQEPVSRRPHARRVLGDQQARGRISGAATRNVQPDKEYRCRRPARPP